MHHIHTQVMMLFKMGEYVQELHAQGLIALLLILK